MNKEQKTFLARAVEITAFGQFGAFGYPAFQNGDWFGFIVACLLLLMLLVSVYGILSINTGGAK
ncbi:MAG: hypothetical protein AB7D06_17935 [Pedobacter sp.]